MPRGSSVPGSPPTGPPPVEVTAERRPVVTAGRPLGRSHADQPLEHRPGGQHDECPDGDVEHDRHAEAVQAGANEDDQEPLGAFGRPAVGGEPAGLGTGLDVGDGLGEHEADQQPRTSAGTAVVDDGPPHQRTEQHPVDDAVAGGVQHRTEGRSDTSGAGHGPVEEVEQQEDGDDERARDEVAARQEPQRRHRRGNSTGERHRVRGDPRPDQHHADGIGQPCQGSPRE